MHGETAFVDAFHRQQAWLFDDVLPLWAERGVDPSGGFFEKLDGAAQPVPSVPRRTRVVARQIYSFAAAGRMGWPGDWQAIVDHGAHALFSRCVMDNGFVLRTYCSETGATDIGFDLYDHAFALFACSELMTTARWRDDALAVANRMISAMDAGFQAPVAGWLDSDAQENLLRSNPHMHLLEAFLALELADPDGQWGLRADAIIGLAIDRLIDRDSGVVREYFGLDWLPLADDRGRIIEPGHHFEWSWLLRRWLDQRTGDHRVIATAANRLAEIAERHGVRDDRWTIDELWDDLTVKSGSARTWPQTERTKACLAQAAVAADRHASASWLGRAATALDATLGFAQRDGLRGLWFDRMDEAGHPVVGPAPASSLYHIMCAAEFASVGANKLRDR